jgi:hypothetical protein
MSTNPRAIASIANSRNIRARIALAGAGLSVVLMAAGCARSERPVGDHLAHEPGKGGAVTSAPSAKGDDVGETDRPSTLSTRPTHKPAVGGEPGNPGNDGGNSSSSAGSTSGPRLGSGRSMDGESSQPAPAAVGGTKGAVPSAGQESPKPTGGGAGTVESPAADGETIDKVRALALSTYEAKGFATAIELAELVIAKRAVDAEMHLLVARAVAGDYTKHANDPVKQELQAKKAADAVRNAWKHGKQDINTYLGGEFTPLANAPAWIGAIGELKARAAKLSGK